MADLSKNNRIIHVLEAVKALGTASPKDVLARIATQLSLDADDPNLRRSIYRDLKDLGDQGRLQVRCFSPDGSELPPEEWETTKNIRIEYSSAEALGPKGSGLLREAGGAFLSPQKSINWWFESLEQINILKNLSLIFEGKAGRLISLRLATEDLPVKILFLRVPIATSEQESLAKDASEAFGIRTASLFGWEKSLSRAEKGQRMGHALLTIRGDRKVFLRDLNSSSGTAWSPLQPFQVRDFVDMQNSQRTESVNTSLLLSEKPWQKIGNADVEISFPAILQLGNFRAILTID